MRFTFMSLYVFTDWQTKISDKERATTMPSRNARMILTRSNSDIQTKMHDEITSSRKAL